MCLLDDHLLFQTLRGYSSAICHLPYADEIPTTIKVYSFPFLQGHIQVISVSFIKPLWLILAY